MITYLNENKYKIAIGLILLLSAYAFGRYAQPASVITKVETHETIKYVEKKTTTKQNNKDIVIIETRLPDGTITKETHIVDKGTVIIDKSKESSDQKDSSSETVVSYNKPQWKAAALLGIADYSLDNRVYGIEIERRVLGPIFIGAWGLNNKTIGVSAGLEF
jgi:hypothetical protein